MINGLPAIISVYFPLRASLFYSILKILKPILNDTKKGEALKASP
jgi:hypothetical protein